MFFSRPINHLVLLLNHLVFINKLCKNLYNITVANIVTNIVIISIVANPLTELSPKIYKTIPAIRVVILASIIAPKLFLLPSLYAVNNFFPFNNSSLILSFEIIIESTAIPIPNIEAAIPVNVRTPPTALNIIKTNNKYTNNETDPSNPLILYLIIKNKDINTKVIKPANAVLLIVFTPKDAD